MNKTVKKSLKDKLQLEMDMNLYAEANMDSAPAVMGQSEFLEIAMDSIERTVDRQCAIAVNGCSGHEYDHDPSNTTVHPVAEGIKSWTFPMGETEEADLATAMATVGEKYGVSTNELHHIFVGTLRMLRSTSAWTK